MTALAMKTCPFCAEEIRAAAIKCRYCQSDLAAAPAPAVPDPVEVEVPSEPEEPEEPEEFEEPTAGRLTLVLSVLSVVALLLAGAVGYVAWDLRAMEAAEEARASGQVAAVEHVERILSYDHEKFDQGTAAARRLMTDSFRKEYDDTVALVREDALSKESVVRAEVVASSVVEADPERVEALLFVNQTTSSVDLEQQRVDLNRVAVSLVPGETGGWLVDGMDAL